MTLSWFFRWTDRWAHPLAPALAPLIVLCVLGLVFWLSAGRGGDYIRSAIPIRQAIGTSLLFVLMPAYQLLMATLLYRRTRWLLKELEPYAASAALTSVGERLHRAPRWSWLSLGIGAVFGLSQNYFVFETFSSLSPHPFDLAFVLGNCLLWAAVALMLSWWLPISLQTARLGASLPVDLHRLDRLQPLARVATLDVLIVAGALALMPLQSLDAEFRLENYVWGIAIGVPVALYLFLLPLLGARRSIRAAKTARIASLNKTLDAMDRSDVEPLELLLGHRDRIAAIPDWPLNTRLITRAIVYVIIPPLAWVAAALVDNVVDRF
ncbi:MAG: hypothetical protein AAGG11_22605 [Pseudomonadota bacterium]